MIPNCYVLCTLAILIDPGIIIYDDNTNFNKWMPWVKTIKKNFVLYLQKKLDWKGKITKNNKTSIDTAINMYYYIDNITRYEI